MKDDSKQFEYKVEIVPDPSTYSEIEGAGEYLGNFGLEGWELVSVVGPIQRGSEKVMYCYFKRQLEEKAKKRPKDKFWNVTK